MPTSTIIVDAKATRAAGPLANVDFWGVMQVARHDERERRRDKHASSQEPPGRFLAALYLWQLPGTGNGPRGDSSPCGRVPLLVLEAQNPGIGGSIVAIGDG